ncbi:hypothetical protein RIF29_15294 [Crotalaria pallida]|uniref:Secreted protein n=1 Tax=Crotalaria pallida TaxID=3830 RepID=A0AAN9FJW1_CROPI
MVAMAVVVLILLRIGPLGGELRTMENSAANFTLDDDFDDDKDDVIKEGGGDNVASEKAIVVEHGLNGHGSHHP